MNDRQQPPGAEDVHAHIASDLSKFFEIMTVKYKGYPAELAEVYTDFLGVFLVASFQDPVGALGAVADQLMQTDVAAIRRGQFQRSVTHGTESDPRRSRILSVAGEPLELGNPEEGRQRDDGPQQGAPNLGRPPR